MLNIRRNVIFSFIEVCTNTLLTFISYRVVVRLGGIQLLGIWSALMAWIGLSRMGDFGLGGASTRFVAALDGRENAVRVRGYIDTAIISNFILVATLSLLSYLAVSHWLTLAVGAAHEAVARPALPWLVGAVISANLCMIVTSSLFSLHIGFIRSIIMISGNLLQLVLVVWLVPRYGITGFAVAQIVQYSLATAAAWIAICARLGKFRLPFAFSWRVLCEMLNVSLMLQASTIANSLFEPLSKMLVSHFGGMQMQGLFEASYKTVTTARNLTSNAATATVPALTRYAQTDIPQAQALYLKTRRNIGRVLLVIFGGIVLASPIISLLWFKALHLQFVGFVALLSIGSIVGGYCTPAYNLGQATGRLKGVVIAMAASDAVLLLGGLAFGLAGMPVMIVALASACIVASNLLVLRLNEPLIGLGTARVAPAGGAWRMTPTPSSKIAKNMPETPEQAVCILEMAMSDDGHRAGYFALLNQLYPTRRAAFTWRAALTRQPVLVPMIEEAFGRYVAVCLLRGLLGRRTVGFLFRPKPALEGRSWRLRAKRWSLRALRQLPSTRTLTILPFSVEPAFATIADEWIYDFEMWDMVGNGQNSNRDGGPLAAEILLATKGRKVCCSIGRQDASKGFDQFSQAYQSAQDLRAGMLFAFGGKVAPALASCAADFAASGGFARARFITDAELLDFYACADLVWCVYAPDYDQASGILGRAMQLGIPVVVRKGSLIQRLCEIEKQAHIAFDETTDPAEFLRLAGHKDPAKGAARALSYRAESLRRLSDALGVMPRMGLG